MAHQPPDGRGGKLRHLGDVPACFPGVRSRRYVLWLRGGTQVRAHHRTQESPTTLPRLTHPAHESVGKCRKEQTQLNGEVALGVTWDEGNTHLQIEAGTRGGRS